MSGVKYYSVLFKSVDIFNQFKLFLLAGDICSVSSADRVDTLNDERLCLLYGSL